MGKGRIPKGERRSVLLGLAITPRDAEDVHRIARAWGVPVSRAAYYLIAGRLAELREERPGVELVELVSQWLAEQGRKLGHHGARSASVAQGREARARGDGGPDAADD